MSEQDKKQQGLIGKFKVERVEPSSRGVDHSDCRYFVLDPQHDAMARRALGLYSVTARVAGYTALADDLDEWLDRVNVPNPEARP